MERHTDLRAILFDFDETLVTLSVDWPQVRAQLRDLFAPSGFESPFKPMTESLRAARDHCEATGQEPLFGEALALLRQVEGMGIDGAIAMPGSKDLLDEVVAKGILYAIVSNNHTEVIRAAIERFAFPPPGAVVGRDRVRYMKPDPEGARKALAELGVEAEESCLVGNSAYDVALGRVMAMRTYIIGERVDCEGSATHLSSLSEMIPLIKVNGRWV